MWLAFQKLRGTRHSPRYLLPLLVPKSATFVAMKLTVAFGNSDVVLAIEIAQDMTADDVKAYALQEAGFPEAGTALVYNNRAVPGAQSMQQAGINEGDMVIIESLGQQREQRPQQQQQQQSSAAQMSDDERIEQVRQQILYTPDLFQALSERVPELANALHDPEDFKKAYLQRQQTDENLAAAMEEMPEMFAPVTMLYVNIEVNGTPVKAFVDSGAQATIISPECAEKCGISHLIDRRHKGTAFGVGQAEIVGRIHMAPIKIGRSFFPCSFTVIGGTNMEFLFGLDNLRHHQANIDLKRNRLVLGDEEVEFLPESELPASAKALASAPTPANPTASRSSSTSSQHSAAGPSRYSSTSSQQSAPAPSRYGSTSSQQSATAPSRTTSNSSQHGAPAPQSSQPQVPSLPTRPQFAESDVQNLMNFGFPKAKVLEALTRAGGNADVAASLLFD